MRIVLFGSTGMIGRAIFHEAKQRGHEVTALTRDRADVTKSEDVARAVDRHDVIVSAVGPKKEPATLLVDAAKALLEGARKAHVNRLVIVGGAGSLYARPGLQLLETPNFPPSWKAIALAHRDALAIWRKEHDLAWTYVSPAALIQPGERTGKYRTGKDE